MSQSIPQMTEEQFMDMQEAELLAAQGQPGVNPNYSAAMFASQGKQNLVEWQLDFRNELEDIEHLLRCDIIVRDKNGQEYWRSNPDKDSIFLNDRGVNDCLRIIRSFLNKNKVLSNYTIEEVKPRVRMLGHELRALIYNNSEAYGIDNDYKRNNYPMIVLAILSMIEDAHRRPINGEERRDLNQARVVQQTDPVQPNINFYNPGNNGGQKKGVFARLAPWNWGKN